MSGNERLDPRLVGEWRASDGFFELVLRVGADGRCQLDEEVGAWTAQGGVFTFEGPETGRERYRYQLSGNVLTLVGGDLHEPMHFQRAGGAMAAPPPPRQQPPPRQPPPRPPTPGGPGQAFQKDAWGVRFTVPAGWRHVEQGGVVLLGSDGEPGLMVARYTPRTSREQASREFAQGYRDDSVQLMPAGPPREWRGPSAQGLTGELQGMTVRGEPVRARVLSLFNEGGGALVLMGLTTPERFEGLARRLEELARSVVLTAPQVPQGMAAIAGSYAYYSSSSVGSSGATLHLMADGTFRREGEMSGRGYDSVASMASQDSGTWSAQGDGLRGLLTLQYASGEVQALPYEASLDPRDRSGYGPALIIGGRTYQKTGAGC